MPEHTIYLHAFNLLQSVGPKHFEKLKNYFGNDFKRAWNAGAEEYIGAGISSEITEAIIQKRKAIDPEKEFSLLKKAGVEAISFDDAGYPILLKETPAPPLLLYTRGPVHADEFSLAVVGTRSPTAYGKELGNAISDDLISSGVTIVSGLALGIDGIAHSAAVRKHARTIAVLGTGIDTASIYPDFHKPLAEKIIEHGGALISEFPPGTTPLKHHFPQRNRIIAGITKGTIVIEAKEKSGALITARYALDYNREVFAVPGPVFSATSRGPHLLLKDGAILVENGNDVLTVFNITPKTEINSNNVSDAEKEILKNLETPLPFDVLQKALGVDTSILNANLSMLELKGLVKDLGNRTYARRG